MRQINFSILTVLVMSCMGFAGSGHSPAVEPIRDVPVISGVDYNGAYIGLGVSAVITYEDESSFFDHEDQQDRTGDITLVGGYDFNQFIALEGRYMTSFTHEDTFERDLWGIYVKPQYSLMDELKVYALLGYGDFQLEGINGSGIDIDENGFQWGLGMSYEIVEDIMVFADYIKIADDVRTDSFFTAPADISSDTITVGLIYKF